MRYTKDGFTIQITAKNGEHNTSGIHIVVNTEKISECIKFIHSNNIDGVYLEKESYSQDNIDFLKETPSIKSVYSLVPGLNLSAIYHLPNLAVLKTIEPPSNRIDLQQLPSLLYLYTFGRNIIYPKNICENLLVLDINKYESTNLHDLQMLTHLEKLIIINGKIETLSGISHCKNLQSIHLTNCRNLLSLGGLDGSLNNIKFLYIYNSNKLTDYKSLSHAMNLECLELRKTGDIDNIEFISKMTKLKRVVLGLKIIDGNLSALDRIPEVGFINFTHYNRKFRSK